MVASRLDRTSARGEAATTPDEREPHVGLLETISGPQDLQGLDDPQLDQLATEIRDLLVRTCSPRGGHLGPNLGVVELTIAIHRAFESPKDRVIFDTGHQAYVHKMLTGRATQFDGLRQQGGLSGYPSQAESPHDVVENSHASTALSYADGLAKAYSLRKEDRHVVAVIGDGALTGGMAWEALNNIATTDGAAEHRRLVMVVNDNGRSYTPTVGGLANHLTALRTDPRYEPVLDMVKRRLHGMPGVGPAVYDALHAVKKGMKDALAPQGLFEDLGLKYVGPIDGHDRVRRGAGAGAGQEVRWPGDRARHDQEGLRLRRRDGARGRPVPLARSVRRDHRRGEGPRPDLDRRLRRRDGEASGSAGPRSSASPPRCCTRSGCTCSPSVSPSGPSTSASPSSTPSPPLPGWRWGACTRWSRSTPPSSTGPSTRC